MPISEDDLNYLRNINTSPGPNAGKSIDPTKPGPSGEAKAIYDTLDTYTDIEDVKRVARGWMDAAAQYLRNEEYYRGVCHEIGETLFGREAHIQDDGGYSESVLVAKLPELAKAAAGTNRERVAEMLRSYAADRSVHGELIPDCPTDGIAARQGNGG